MSKRISEYIACFGYFDKSLIVLSVTTGSISIASFATVIGAPVAMESARDCQKMLRTTRNKKNQNNKTVMLARSKLNSIESKISEALITNEISREDFMTNINEKKNIPRTK